jgi:hypothetical protein
VTKIAGRYRLSALHAMIGRRRARGRIMKVFNSLPGRTALSVVAILLATPIAAQPAPIEVAANATWQHETAKVGFPPQLGGFRRAEIVDYGDQRLDVSARYFNEESRTTATLYLFRAPLPDVAVWHDRALTSIRPHEVLGTPDHASAVTAPFAPPGIEVASGLLTVMPLSGRSARSTALAVFPQGPWLVKARITSDRLDPAQLKTHLESLLGALPIEPLGTAQPAAAMADCAERLEFRRARRAGSPDLATQLLMSTLRGIAEEKTEAAGESPAGLAPTRFCRDHSSRPEYGVYRPEGAKDSYVIGLNDAGASVGVHRQPAAGLLDEDAAKEFWLELSTVGESATYRGFRSLPTPAQVIEVLQREQPVSSVKRSAGGDTSITLTPD